MHQNITKTLKVQLKRMSNSACLEICLCLAPHILHALVVKILLSFLGIEYFQREMVRLRSSSPASDVEAGEKAPLASGHRL